MGDPRRTESSERERRLKMAALQLMPLLPADEHDARAVLFYAGQLLEGYLGAAQCERCALVRLARVNGEEPG